MKPIFCVVQHKIMLCDTKFCRTTQIERLLIHKFCRTTPVHVVRHKILVSCKQTFSFVAIKPLPCIGQGINFTLNKYIRALENITRKRVKNFMMQKRLCVFRVMYFRKKLTIENYIP
jgi:hypothetical protein